MNVANVSATLTTAINNSVTAGDLVAPLNIPATVNTLIAELQARELEAGQHATDVAWDNEVARAVKAGTPTDPSKIG